MCILHESLKLAGNSVFIDAHALNLTWSMAKRIATQLRGPDPNGSHAHGWRFSRSSLVNLRGNVEQKKGESIWASRNWRWTGHKGKMGRLYFVFCAVRTWIYKAWREIKKTFMWTIQCAACILIAQTKQWVAGELKIKCSVCGQGLGPKRLYLVPIFP